MSSKDYKYKAFISYSHQDKKWGAWLHKGLETYRIPKGLVGKETRHGVTPKRLFPIFRDREELPTSAELGDVINQALGDSSHLIVICSPRSAKSRWVNEEIKEFKRLGKADQVLCLIVDGEPNAADKPNLRQEECFPEAAKYEVGEEGELSTRRTEPIAADAREGRDGKRDSLLKLVAGLLGVGFDDLKQRQSARRQKWMAVISGVSVALVAVMAGLTLWALDQQQEAERQRAEAVQARDAEAEQRQEAEHQREAAVQARVAEVEQRQVAESQRVAAAEAKVREDEQRQLAKTEQSKVDAATEFLRGIFTPEDPGTLKGVDDKDNDSMKLLLSKAVEKMGLLEDQPELAAEIRTLIGTASSTSGLYGEALTHHEESLAIRLQALGPDHPDVAMSYNNLGLAHDDNGDHDKALEHYEKAEAIYLKALGPELTSALDGLIKEFQRASSQIQFETNNKDGRKSKGKYGKRIGDGIDGTFKQIFTGHPFKGAKHFGKSFLSPKSGILPGVGKGAVRGAKKILTGNYGQPTSAKMPLGEVALSFIENTSEYEGDPFSDIGATYHNIGFACKKLLEHDKALKYYEKALAIRLKTLGPDHPKVATTYFNIGTIYVDQGQKEKAMAYLIEAEAINLKKLGPDHPNAKDE